MRNVEAVVFDWRGTLVTGLDARSWIREGLRVAHGDADEESIGRTLRAVTLAAGQPDRLSGPTVDTSADLHRETYYAVFEEAGLDADVADALYAVESDPRFNRFADDVAPVMRSLVEQGCKIGILSDIHFACVQRSLSRGSRSSWTPSCCPSSTVSKSRIPISSPLPSTHSGPLLPRR